MVDLLEELLDGFQPKKSCKEYVTELAHEPGMAKLPHIVQECATWLESFIAQNINPNNLTEDEIFAVGLYTWDLGFNGEREENFYFNLNKVLQERNPQNQLELHKWAGYLYFLQSALDKIPDKEIIVFRRIPSDSDITKYYKKGTPVYWSGYYSASTSFEKAKEFAYPDGVVMKMTVYNGKSIRDYASFPVEDEILLSPNMKFQLASDKDDSQGRLRVVELIQQRETAAKH